MFVVVQSQPEAVNRRLVVWRVRDGRAAMTPLSASQRHASLLKQNIKISWFQLEVVPYYESLLGIIRR